MTITRRGALLGAGAVVAVVGLPTAVAAWWSSQAATTTFAGSTDSVVAAAGHWHRAFDRTLELSEWWLSHQDPDLDELKQNPGLAQEYEERHATLRVAGKAFHDARKQLLTKAPVTVAGAVALLGCASRAIAERRRAQIDVSTPGTRARVAFCVFDYLGQNEMVLAAQPVLERLIGEAPS